jgi:uncharacterized membrane protein YgcG
VPQVSAILYASTHVTTLKLHFCHSAIVQFMNHTVLKQITPIILILTWQSFSQSSLLFFKIRVVKIIMAVDSRIAGGGGDSGGDSGGGSGGGGGVVVLLLPPPLMPLLLVVVLLFLFL